MLKGGAALYIPIHSEGALYQHVVKQIENLILASQLKPGDKLAGERELAKEFEVSRTVIREAVKTLQQRGLVEIRQGRGIFIIQPKVELVTDSIRRILSKYNTTLQHLIEARKMLELSIVPIAARRIQDEQLQRLYQSIEAMEKNVGDAEKFVFHDMEFHVAMAESAENPVYLLFMNSILELVEKNSIYMALQSPTSMRRAQEHHKRIYEALAERNEERAISALQGHFQQIWEDIEVSTAKEVGESPSIERGWLTEKQEERSHQDWIRKTRLQGGK